MGVSRVPSMTTKVVKSLQVFQKKKVNVDSKPQKKPEDQTNHVEGFICKEVSYDRFRGLNHDVLRSFFWQVFGDFIILSLSGPFLWYQSVWMSLWRTVLNTTWVRPGVWSSTETSVRVHGLLSKGPLISISKEKLWPQIWVQRSFESYYV